MILFMYGIFRNEYNVRCVSELATHIAPATIPGRLYVEEGIARLLPATAGGHDEKIIGELWDIPDSDMKHIDHIEYEYERRPVIAVMPTGETVAGQAYFCLKPLKKMWQPKRLYDGDYLHYCEVRDLL